MMNIIWIAYAWLLTYGECTRWQHISVFLSHKLSSTVVGRTVPNTCHYVNY